MMLRSIAMAVTVPANTPWKVAMLGDTLRCAR